MDSRNSLIERELSPFVVRFDTDGERGSCLLNVRGFVAKDEGRVPAQTLWVQTLPNVRLVEEPIATCSPLASGVCFSSNYIDKWQNGQTLLLASVQNSPTRTWMTLDNMC